jgi:hypothetical protein
MKLPFIKSKKEGDEEQTRGLVKERLKIIKKGEKNEELTSDVKGLVKGLADGDG